MAWLFDDSNTDDVQISDNAALTFPDADWTIAGWIKLTSNTGSFYQYFCSWNAFNAVNSFQWYFGEASSPEANKLLFLHEDAGADQVLNEGSGTPGTRTDWMHLAMTRSGSTVEHYVDAVSEGSDVNASFDAIDWTGAFYLGSRATSPTARYLDGAMAEWAKWDRALSTPEIAALANGMRPWRFGESLKWYLPMKVGGTGGDYEDWGPSRLTVTNNGSLHADHPPTGLWTPRLTYPTVPAAAGGGVSTILGGGIMV